MPRKPKYSSQELVDTALAIIREEGEDSLSARNLVKRLGTAPATIFTHFSSMEELEKAVMTKAKALYNEYAERGFSKSLPFKGFGVEHVKFAMEEPNLYNFLFIRNKANGKIEDIIEREGHRDRLIEEAMKVFCCSKEIAEVVLENLVVYMSGLAMMCSKGICSFTEEELSKMFGMAAGGFLYAASQNSAWYSIVPKEGEKIEEDSPYTR